MTVSSEKQEILFIHLKVVSKRIKALEKERKQPSTAIISSERLRIWRARARGLRYLHYIALRCHSLRFQELSIIDMHLRLFHGLLWDTLMDESSFLAEDTKWRDFYRPERWRYPDVNQSYIHPAAVSSQWFDFLPAAGCNIQERTVNKIHIRRK